MAYIDEFNGDRNNPRYIDTEQLIEYIFLGFNEPLPIEKKLELIKKSGRPRSKPLNAEKIETNDIIVTLPGSSVETQVIYKRSASGAKVKGE
jgi:hypothetical protein